MTHPRSMYLALLLALGTWSACSDRYGAKRSDGGADVATDADAGAAIADLAPDRSSAGDATVDPWKPVTDRMEAEVAADKIKGGFALLDVYDAATGKLLYSRGFGSAGKTRNSLLAVASASKWVTSTVILGLVADGALTLDDTTAKHLKWAGTPGQITLRQLLTFTSGLRDHTCAFNAQITLAKCVAAIEQAGVESAPGKVFYYGNAHMAVAGRMAEVATGKLWGALYQERMVTPLGLGAGTIYYALPKQKLGKFNPLLAGGLNISTADYGKFLTALIVGPKTLLPANLLAEQHKEQWAPGTTIGQMPAAAAAGKYHYALGCWRMCKTPDSIAACDAELMVNSAGAFGFVPWWDKKHGYYAVLGAEAGSSADNASVYNSALVNDQLRPLIAKALGQ